MNAWLKIIDVKNKQGARIRRIAEFTQVRTRKKNKASQWQQIKNNMYNIY